MDSLKTKRQLSLGFTSMTPSNKTIPSPKSKSDSSISTTKTVTHNSSQKTPPSSPTQMIIPKTRRRSSLSKSTTLEDMIAGLRAANIEQHDHNNGSNNVTTKKRSGKVKLCYKCSSYPDLIYEDRLNTIINNKRRRRSSSSILYSELLSNSNSVSKQVPFTLKMSVSEGGKFRQLLLPFNARFMGSSDNSSGKADTIESASSPYFSEIDLNQHYIDKEIKKPLKSDKRKFPGFSIPKKGNLQLVIYNSERTTTSLILLPYDLTKLKKNRKKITKFKSFKLITYASDSYDKKILPSPAEAEPETETENMNSDDYIQVKKLVNELELKFVNYKDKKFYLFDKIKILFSSRASFAEDYKLPLNIYTLCSNSKLLNGISKESFQFNPKIPVLPYRICSVMEKLHSGQFKVDIHHFTAKCSYCDRFDRSKGSGVHLGAHSPTSKRKTATSTNPCMPSKGDVDELSVFSDDEDDSNF
ncbi:unnamed protein product [Ambrosiozyma monospora]|uniref:Unnamed protein product n=1 Tax=Ambrosiozyma monospora TaxID=43982 RepID=A0A9W6YVM6_AMBMO|nr:unnamed protein product [Ambrosiozyma monospora]